MKPYLAILWMFSWLPAVATEPPASKFEAIRSLPVPTEFTVDLPSHIDWAGTNSSPQSDFSLEVPAAAKSDSREFLAPVDTAEAAPWWRETDAPPSVALPDVSGVLHRSEAKRTPASLVAAAALLVVVACSLLRRRFIEMPRMSARSDAPARRFLASAGPPE